MKKMLKSFTKNVIKSLTIAVIIGIIFGYDIVQMYLNKIHTSSDFCGVAHVVPH